MPGQRSIVAKFGGCDKRKQKNERNSYGDSKICKSKIKKNERK